MARTEAQNLLCAESLRGGFSSSPHGAIEGNQGDPGQHDRLNCTKRLDEGFVRTLSRRDSLYQYLIIA